MSTLNKPALDENVLVVGSSGFLGRAIIKRLAPAHTVISTFHRTPLPDAAPYDFFNDDISDLLQRFNVATVIFTAATEKEVSGDFGASVERFLRGVQDRRLVYLSSDAVFSGEKGLYTERDLPTPTTSYGRNLLHFETRIAETCGDFCIVRPSYIYGFSDGLDARLSRARAALQAGQEVTVFEDMFKSPLGVGQVAEAVLELSSDFTGIVHVAGERLSVFNFYARAMNALAVNTDGLRRETMTREAGLASDTSLDVTLWQQLTGMTPLSIEDTLSG